MRLRLAAVVTGLALIGACSPRPGDVTAAQFRQDACAPASPLASNLISYLRQVVSADSSADSELVITRTRYQLPLMPAAEVRLVDDPTVCTRAAAAYTQAVHDTTVAGQRRRVNVVQLGNRYAVGDPFTPARAGEFELWAIFDARWRPIVVLAS